MNPTFTSYDEIWTWIPVVTESQNNCSSQIYPSARENSSSNDAPISTVTLPSYENAVRQSENTVPRSSAQNIVNPHAISSESHYETIPANTGQSHLPTSGGATAASVSRPHNSLSALTAALQSPLPERRLEPSSQRENNTAHHGRRGENRNRERSQMSHQDEIRQTSQNFYRQYNSRNRSQRIVERNPGKSASLSSSYLLYINLLTHRGPTHMGFHCLKWPKPHTCLALIVWLSIISIDTVPPLTIWPFYLIHVAPPPTPPSPYILIYII